MTDVFSKKERSKIMRSVKSINTKPEHIVRNRLHKLGFRFTLHQRKLPGTPDIVLPKYKAIINVNGCFWHGHKDCKRSTLPKSNSQYWQNKINRNKQRDELNEKKLNELGWIVIIIYECELKASNIDSTFKKLLTCLTQNIDSINI
jgi:DNA mismatch endonuclease (patch repair protein)